MVEAEGEREIMRMGEVARCGESLFGTCLCACVKNRSSTDCAAADSLIMKILFNKRVSNI